MNTKSIKMGVLLILKGLGEDIHREGLRDTPDRIAKMYSRFMRDDIQQDNKTIAFTSDFDGTISIQQLPFHSLCEHHLLPFWGNVSITYKPGRGSVVGLSKIVGIVSRCASKLQLQEELAKNIMQEMKRQSNSEDVMVTMEATHLCLLMKNNTWHNITMSTVTSSGIFEADK